MGNFRQDVVWTYQQAMDLQKKHPDMLPCETKVTIACSKILMNIMNMIERIKQNNR